MSVSDLLSVMATPPNNEAHASSNAPVTDTFAAIAALVLMPDRFEGVHLFPKGI